MSESEKQIREFLKDKKVLLATDSTTDRTTWKKLFHEMGVNHSAFMIAHSFQEAHETIDKNFIHIVFSSYNIKERNSIPLLDFHINKYPDRSKYFFFMASEKNSLAVASAAAEHEVDGLVIKPYNQKDLAENITDSLLRKINMKKEEQFFHQISGEIRSEKFDEAKQNIEKYMENKPDSPHPYYLAGLLKHVQEDFDGALNDWVAGLEKDENHHRILTNLFDTLISLKEFTKAYNYARRLTDNYPINPERIPNFIRVSLATKNYQDLVDFCEMILEVESDLTGIKRPIAAALSICGKNFAEDITNTEIVVSSSLRAMSLTDSHSQIYITALHNIIAMEKYEMAKEQLDKTPTDNLSDDLHEVDLILTEKLSNAGEAFIKGQNLLKIGVATTAIYLIILRSGIEIGKTKSQIEDLAFDAAKAFPGSKDKFIQLSENYNPEA